MRQPQPHVPFSPFFHHSTKSQIGVMTAYGAVISLMNTIDGILRCSRFILVGRSRQIIEVVHKELEPWAEILKAPDMTSPSRSRKKINALDRRMKDMIWEFEDSLESLVAEQIPPQFQSMDVLSFSIDLQSLQNDVGSLLKNMLEDYGYELLNMPEDEPISTIIGFCGANSEMIGLSDQFQKVKTELMRRRRGSFQIFELVGAAGVGKTTLAKNIYQDAEIQSKYECRAWVTVGRIPQSTAQISQGIVAQLQGDDERLDGKNCLIVLDDVWEAQVYRSLLNSLLPCIRNGVTQILATARHSEPLSIDELWWYEIDSSACVVRFLDEEESMELLCHKVFGDEEDCPPQLYKAATKIAKRCEGLPLLIVTVADLLSQSKTRDPEYWNDAAEERNSVFTDAHNEISKVLFPSYEYLPQSLKMPFLFMGVFPRGYETSRSKIINMLTAEGLLGGSEKKKQCNEASDWQCVGKLAESYKLVLYKPKSICKTCYHWEQRFENKTYWLHSAWRHVCRGEASKGKFYHVLNKLIDASEECVKGQRGLCLENNVLFGIKQFRNSMRLNYASFARFLLFYGPHHQYPIPIDVGFRLLREIDALTQRFYTFPIEILTLFQLKYLALTCNGELPSTISKLFNLRVLIIHPHINIRCCKAPSYVPIQIWDMQELVHIEILGKSLRAPCHVASLKNLSTLVGVNASICTILELSERIPNIRKLSVQIELTPYDDHNILSRCFVCVSKLKDLETLKCSILNPVVDKYDYAVPAPPNSLMFPVGLKKLHLSGMGFPWEYIDVIGSLPTLEVLKLRSYAFRGSKWEVQTESFRKLAFLLIEDSDLVQCKLGNGSFCQLHYLSMKHCYKLQEVPWPSHFGLGNIELVDCNPLALNYVKQLQLRPHYSLDVIASYYFDEKPTTIELRSGEAYDEDRYEEEEEEVDPAVIEKFMEFMEELKLTTK